MAYPRLPRDLSDEKIKQFSDDLLSRKEYFQLKWDPARNFRDPNEYDILRGKFFRLLSYQLFCASFENPNTEYNRLFVNYQTGTGKCFARGTKILMYDGGIKQIEDIEPGAQVMGDDATPRNVLSVARGRDVMYEVKPEYGGDSFICNSAHIMILSDGARLYKMTMRDYVEKFAVKNQEYSALGLVKAPAIPQCLTVDTLTGTDETLSEFVHRIDPYIVGALSACQSVDVVMHCSDTEIIFRKNYHVWKQYYSHLATALAKIGFCITDNIARDYVIAERHFLSARSAESAQSTANIKILAKCLTDCAIIARFCRSDAKKRMRFLAGLFDYCAMMPGDSAESVKIGLRDHPDKSQFITEILFCLRSLGIIADYQQHKNKIILHFTHDTGEIINTIIAEMKNRENIKHFMNIIGDVRADSPPRYSAIPFTFRELPPDDYYGITVDDNARFLLHDFTVVHNSGVAIAIAQSFIDVYRKNYQQRVALEGLSRRNFAEIDKTTPSVFIIGFTKANMVRELLKYPEFGFITIQERAELDRLQKNILSGDPTDMKRYKDFYNMLKRRIGNKSRDGFYKFFGYQEFVNRLFISDTINLTELEGIAMQRMNAVYAEARGTTGDSAREIPENISTLEDVIKEYIDQGKIKINKQLLDQFENSLLICDEVQNTYNSFMKNNYGVAIQYVLDYNPNVRGVFLSATPINNSPTEIIDMMNYLLPPNRKITKKEFFANSREMRPGKLEELGRLSYGRVSFLQDINPAYYPERIFNGEVRQLRRPVENLTAIPYLLFKLCPLAPVHLKTYRDFLRDSGIGPDDRPVIPTEGYTLFDMVFPDPRDQQDPPTGLYKSSEIRAIIPTSTEEQKNAVGIQSVKLPTGGFIFTGEWLSADNLIKYSTKYHEMWMTVADIFARTRERIRGKPADEHKYESEKIMIYHDRVKLSGVLLIKEILKVGGFVDEIADPIDNSICTICGYNYAEHSAKLAADNIAIHDFAVARIVMAHSEIDKRTMENSLAKYNSMDNSYGMNYKTLIGSKIIREGYDIKDVREYFIMSVPVNIPAFIQELGRTIRKGSHINLPPEKRKVNIRLYLGIIPNDITDINPVFVEEYRYAEKLSDYMVIQEIEREIHKYALDGAIHRDIIMPLNLIREYFPDSGALQRNDITREQADDIAKTLPNPERNIGSLYFYPHTDIPESLADNEYSLDRLNLNTFSAYGYNRKETATISYVIKRLFLLHSVWKYSDLWQAVRQPPFGLETNPKLFDESNFIIALDNLVLPKQSYIDKSLEKEMNAGEKINDKIFIKLLFDPDERYIYRDGVKHKIEHIGEYYILFPILPAEFSANNLANNVLEYSGRSHDCSGTTPDKICSSGEAFRDIIIKDIDSFMRPVRIVADTRINIDAYMQEYKKESNYEVQKSAFIAKYRAIDDDSAFMGFLGEYSADFHTQLLSDIIVWNIAAFLIGEKGKKSVDVAGVFDRDVQKVFNKVLDIYDQFGGIIYVSDVLKYRDVCSKITGGMIKYDEKNRPFSDLADDVVAGFQAPGSLLIYNGPADNPINGLWVKVTKSAMNIRTEFQENQKLIGYYEKTPDGVIKFKIRRPTQEIKKLAGKTTDIRSAERGIVCNTKNKPELLKYIDILGINLNSEIKKKGHSRDLVDSKNQLKIKGMCGLIRDKLIALEIRERQNDTKIKYFYLWYDIRPEIASIFQRVSEEAEY